MEELFYTKEHDWIRFSGTEACIGIASFKLTGILKIDSIDIFDYRKGNIVEEGSLLLHIHYRDYVIPMQAPVTCTLLDINPAIRDGYWECILENPERDGWLFKIKHIKRKNDSLLRPSFYLKRFPSGPTI